MQAGTLRAKPPGAAETPHATLPRHCPLTREPRSDLAHASQTSSLTVLRGMRPTHAHTRLVHAKSARHLHMVVARSSAFAPDLSRGVRR